MLLLILICCCRMSWLWWHAIVTLIVVMLILDCNGIGHAMSNSQSLDKEKWSLSWLIVALCVTLCVRFNAPVSVYGGSFRWRTILRGNEKNCKSSMKNSFVRITSHPIPWGACSHSRAIPQKTCSCCELCRCHWRESWVVNGGWDICLPPWCAIANANGDGRSYWRWRGRCVVAPSWEGERAVDEEDGALSLCHRPEEMQRR